MTHVESNLAKGEQVIQRAEISKINLIVNAVLAGILFLVCLNLDDSSMTAVGLIVAVVLVVKPLIDIFTTELAITNKRVVGKTGLLNTHTMDSPISKVQNIAVSQKLAGKLFNYSTLAITTAAASYKYHNIANAEQFKQVLSEQIEAFDNERIKKQAAEMARAINGATSADE